MAKSEEKKAAWRERREIARKEAGERYLEIQWVLRERGPWGDITCYRCHRKGHYAALCWEKRKKIGRSEKKLRRSVLALRLYALNVVRRDISLVTALEQRRRVVHFQHGLTVHKFASIVSNQGILLDIVVRGSVEDKQSCVPLKHRVKRSLGRMEAYCMFVRNATIGGMLMWSAQLCWSNLWRNSYRKIFLEGEGGEENM